MPEDKQEYPPAFHALLESHLLEHTLGQSEFVPKLNIRAGGTTEPGKGYVCREALHWDLW